MPINVSAASALKKFFTTSVLFLHELVQIYSTTDVFLSLIALLNRIVKCDLVKPDVCWDEFFRATAFIKLASLLTSLFLFSFILFILLAELSCAVNKFVESYYGAEGLTSDVGLLKLRFNINKSE